MKKITYLLLFLTTLLTGQDITPIVNLRVNDGSGIPVTMGQFFKVRGVVTASNHFGTSGPGAVQDETGAISVYGSSFAGPLVPGDTVEVYSSVTHFNGLTQFDMAASGSSVVKIASGTVPQPETMTIAQIAAQQWNGYEEHESKLIRIDNCTISGSGNFSSGTNYNITDGTGTISVRIDNNVTSVIGTAIPSGSVDIVGILAQYKFGAPFNSGYQIMPRFLADFLYDGAPQILTPVLASDITTSSFKVYFNTVRNGDSRVAYGLTENLELDTLIVSSDTTAHTVQVNGLIPGTRYYFKALSVNAAGSSVSGLQTVITASDDPEVGNINVYFNYPVDTTVALPGNAAQGNVNFQQKLVERINRANYSIDMAVYSFTGLNDAIAALLTAKSRGVKIRVVYDSRTNQPGMTTLLNAGIKMSKRQSTNGIMHNKFMIFDARDTLLSNDWTWTGSYNLTTTEQNWKNNVIEINDPSLSQTFQIEFEEMWGSNTDEPNAANARFGSQKLDNTPHSFTVGGRDVQLYFSPSDQTTSKIMNTINTSNFNVFYALYSFTRGEIATTLRNRHDIGVNLRGIIDQTGDASSQYNYLKSFSEVFDNASSGTLHHKYAIIDPSHPESFPTVLTGSHNWSTNAETNNDENTLIIKDLFVANQYMQEFKKRYNDEGGTGVFIVPTGANESSMTSLSGFELFQNYPNPFNPLTTIKITINKRQSIRLTLTDILGRELALLFAGEVEPGLVAVDFSPSVHGLDLASGVYLYRVTGENLSAVRKMVYLK